MAYRETSIHLDSASFVSFETLRVPLGHERRGENAPRHDGQDAYCALPLSAGCVAYGVDDVATYATSEDGTLKVSLIGQRKTLTMPFGRPVWAAVFTIIDSIKSAPELDIVVLTCDQHIIRVRYSFEGQGAHRICHGTTGLRQRVLLCHAQSSDQLFVLNEANAVVKLTIIPSWELSCDVLSTVFGENLLVSILRKVNFTQQQRALDLTTYTARRGTFLVVLFDNFQLRTYDVDQESIIDTISLKQLDHYSHLISMSSTTDHSLAWMSSPLTRRYIHVARGQKNTISINVFCSCTHNSSAVVRFETTGANGQLQYRDAIALDPISANHALIDFFISITAGKQTLTTVWMGPGYYYIRSRRILDRDEAMQLPIAMSMRNDEIDQTAWQRIDSYPAQELLELHFEDDESYSAIVRQYMSKLLNVVSQQTLTLALQSFVEVNNLVLVWDAESLMDCLHVVLEAYLVDKSDVAAYPNNSSIQAEITSVFGRGKQLLSEVGVSGRINPVKQLMAHFFDELYMLCLQQHWLANIPLAISEVHIDTTIQSEAFNNTDKSHRNNGNGTNITQASRAASTSTVFLIKSESLSVLRRLHPLESFLADLEDARSTDELKKQHIKASSHVADMQPASAFNYIVQLTRSSLPSQHHSLSSQLDRSVGSGQGLEYAKQLLRTYRQLNREESDKSNTRKNQQTLAHTDLSRIAGGASELIIRICDNMIGLSDGNKDSRWEHTLSGNQNGFQSTKLLEVATKQMLESYVKLLRNCYIVLVGIRASHPASRHIGAAVLLQVTNRYRSVLNLLRIFQVYVRSLQKFSGSVYTDSSEHNLITGDDHTKHNTDHIRSRPSLAYPKTSDIHPRLLSSLGMLLFGSVPFTPNANSLTITTTAHGYVTHILSKPMMRVNLAILFDHFYARPIQEQQSSSTLEAARMQDARQVLLASVNRVRQLWAHTPPADERLVDSTLDVLFGYTDEEFEQISTLSKEMRQQSSDVKNSEMHTDAGADIDLDKQISPLVLHQHSPLLLRLLFKSMWHLYCRNISAAHNIMKEIGRLSDTILERYHIYHMLAKTCTEINIPEGAIYFLDEVLMLEVPQTVLPDFSRNLLFEQLVHYQLVCGNFTAAIAVIQRILSAEARTRCIRDLVKAIAVSPTPRRWITTLDLIGIMADFETELEFRAACSDTEDMEDYHTLCALFHTRFGNSATAVTHYYQDAMKLQKALTTANWGVIVPKRARALLKVLDLLLSMEPHEQFLIVEVNTEPSYERAFKKLKLDTQGTSAADPYANEGLQCASVQVNSQLIRLEDVEIEYFTYRAMHDLVPLFPEKVRFNSEFNLADAVSLYATAYHRGMHDFSAKRNPEWFWKQAIMYTERFQNRLRSMTRGQDFELIMSPQIV